MAENLQWAWLLTEAEQDAAARKGTRARAKAAIAWIEFAEKVGLNIGDTGARLQQVRQMDKPAAKKFGRGIRDALKALNQVEMSVQPLDERRQDEPAQALGEYFDAEEPASDGSQINISGQAEPEDEIVTSPGGLESMDGQTGGIIAPVEPTTAVNEEKKRSLRPKNYDRLELAFDGLISSDAVAALRSLPDDAKRVIVNSLYEYWKEYAGSRGKNDPKSVRRLELMLVEGLNLGEVAELEDINPQGIESSFETLSHVLGRVPEDKFQSMIRRVMAHRQDTFSSASDSELSVSEGWVMPIDSELSPDVEPAHEAIANEFCAFLGIEDEELKLTARRLLNPGYSSRLTPDDHRVTALLASKIRQMDGLNFLCERGVLDNTQVQSLRELSGLFRNAANGETIERPPMKSLGARIEQSRRRGEPAAKELAAQTYGALEALMTASSREQPEDNPEHRAYHSELTVWAKSVELSPEQTAALWQRIHVDTQGLYREYDVITMKPGLDAMQRKGIQQGAIKNFSDSAQRALKAFLVTFAGEPKNLDGIAQILGGDVVDAEGLVRKYIRELLQ